MDKKRQIILIPAGGLGNRMRAIASGVALANKTGRALKIIWQKDNGLAAEFSDLFSADNLPFDFKQVSGLMYSFIYDVPRKKNLYLTTLTSLFDRRSRIHHISNKENNYLFDQPLEDKINNQKRDVIILSGSQFYPFPDSLLRSIFRPHAEVRKVIENILCNQKPFVGMHIRRTDNLQSIQQSPIDLFKSVIEKELKEDRTVKIYVASDSDEVKNDLKTIYGDSVITNNNTADRSSLSGMREGLAEMLILASCKQIYGSFWSSFSEISSMIGGVPLTILSTSKN